MRYIIFVTAFAIIGRQTVPNKNHAASHFPNASVGAPVHLGTPDVQAFDTHWQGIAVFAVLPSEKGQAAGAKQALDPPLQKLPFWQVTEPQVHGPVRQISFATPLDGVPAQCIPFSVCANVSAFA